MAVEHLATWVFGIAAGTWIVLQFLLRREAQPGAELQIGVDLAGRQADRLLIEVWAVLANRGFVRHRYRRFRLVVRYLLPGDAVADGDARITFQVRFPHSIDERIHGTQRLFSNAEYIDPGLTFRHSYVTHIPADTTFVLVLCSLEFPTLWKWRPAKKNAQRLFAVPAGDMGIRVEPSVQHTYE